MTDELEALNQAAAAGDRAALDELIEHYLPQLQAFVRLRAGAAARARESSADLVQSVCRELLEHGERFQHASESAFRQWLFTTALRKILHRHDFHRAQKRDVRRDVPLEAGRADVARLLECYHTFSSPSGHLAGAEEFQRIEAAFDQLSEGEREVVTLARIVGLSRAEIGARTGKSEASVRSTLYRALGKLSALLDEEDAPS
jgi:RNA polymerase sigma-70 factor (subfamily 1)